MLRNFRVLVIDDDENVVKRLHDRISIERRPFEGHTYQIDLRVIRILVDKVNDETSKISQTTLKELAAACAQAPHVVFADYGYAQKEVIENLRQRSNKGEEIAESDLAGKILTTSDLADAIQLFIQDETIDSYIRNNLKRNFLEHKAKLYLYTYTSKDFIKALKPVSARAKRTRAAFPSYEVIALDTKDVFYNGDEFDWPNPQSKHDGKFYAHLVSVLINKIIQRELLEHILSDAKRLKYVRVQRSVMSVALIVAIGGAIGATSEWLGGRIVGLASSGFYIPALIIVGLTVLLILIIGLVIPFVFEKTMSGLIAETERENKSSD